MKKIVSFVSFLLLVTLFLTTNVNAQSTSPIRLTFEAGINGKIKMYEGFPLTITVENEGSDPFQGDLVIRYTASYSSTAAQVIGINVGAGESEIYTVSLPGQSDYGYYQPNQELITLYEGNWKEGKKVSYRGSKRITYSYIDPSVQTIGLLSENPDRLSKFRAGTQKQWFSLTDDNLPKDALALEMFDVLFIDEFPVGTLPESQQEALLEWVNRGGILVVGATPNPSQTYGKISNLLPIQQNQEYVLESVFLGERNPELTILQVFTGEIDNANVLVEYDQYPLIVEKEFGSGKLLQTTFSIGDEPTISTEGYPNWLMKFIGNSNIGSFYGYDIYDQIYWDIGQLNEYFQGMDISTSQLVSILVIYILILVPGLYFFLRWKDKREHAWWIIPTIAIITSLGIFAYGAKDRIVRPLQNEIGLFLSDENQLSGYYLVSIQSNTSGDYQLNVNKDEYVPVPLGQDFYNLPSDDRLTHLVDYRNQLEVVFPKVEYWSTRSIAGKAFKTVEGTFESELTYENGKKLTGTITNNFPYRFKEVFIWSGSKKYSLGPMEPGETLSVNEEAKGSFLSAPMTQGYVSWNFSADDIDETIREAMENSMVNLTGFTLGKPVIAGYTEDAIISVEMDDKDAGVKRNSLIIEPFDVSLEFAGDVTISNDQLSFEMEAIDGGSYEIYPYGPGQIDIYADPGTYNLIYTLPSGLENKQFSLSRLSINVLGNTDPFLIFNNETGEFEEIDFSGSRVTWEEDVEKYLSNDGKIILQNQKSANRHDPYIQPPQLTLKGSVGQ